MENKQLPIGLAKQAIMFMLNSKSQIPNLNLNLLEIEYVGLNPTCPHIFNIRIFCDKFDFIERNSESQTKHTESQIDQMYQGVLVSILNIAVQHPLSLYAEKMKEAIIAPNDERSVATVAK